MAINQTSRKKWKSTDFCRATTYIFFFSLFFLLHIIKGSKKKVVVFLHLNIVRMWQWLWFKRISLPTKLWNLLKYVLRVNWRYFFLRSFLTQFLVPSKVQIGTNEINNIFKTREILLKRPKLQSGVWTKKQFQIRQNKN